MATQTLEVKATPIQNKPISARASIKAPKTVYLMNEDTGEVEQVTTLTLTMIDMPLHEVHRLARAAGEKVQLDVELAPTIEQMKFDI